MGEFIKLRAVGAGLSIVLGVCSLPMTAAASEGGASIYLLGSGGPGAALLPPVEGVFLANTAYYYKGDASADKQFVIGSNVVAGLKAEIAANFTTLLWVPTTNLLGGTLAFGATLPVGVPSVDVSAVITGPRGRSVEISRSDDAFVVGDPLVNAALTWTWSDFHVQASTFVNIPIGDYREGQLANLSFNRWATDVSLAATWHEEKSGWDISGKAGLTFNGENPATDYRTGTEFHLEGAVEKTFSPKFSAGLQAYYFDQVSGDSGTGATLGPFKGRVAGLGATAAYDFTLAKRPATLRFHAMKEFDAINRLEGEAYWLDFTIPLMMKMPSGAGPER